MYIYICIVHYMMINLSVCSSFCTHVDPGPRHGGARRPALRPVRGRGRRRQGLGKGSIPSKRDKYNS